MTDSGESNNAEEAFDKICDEKNQFQHSQADTAKQGDLPADNSKENCVVEKVIKSKNKSEPTSSHQDSENL